MLYTWERIKGVNLWMHNYACEHDDKVRCKIFCHIAIRWRDGLSEKSVQIPCVQNIHVCADPWHTRVKFRKNTFWWTETGGRYLGYWIAPQFRTHCMYFISEDSIFFSPLRWSKRATSSKQNKLALASAGGRNQIFQPLRHYANPHPAKERRNIIPKRLQICAAFHIPLPANWQKISSLETKSESNNLCQLSNNVLPREPKNKQIN